MQKTIHVQCLDNRCVLLAVVADYDDDDDDIITIVYFYPFSILFKYDFRQELNVS